MGITAIICIACVVLAIIIVLTIIVYNQMLLLNEVNKRLILLTKDSIEKERNSISDLQEALTELEKTYSVHSNQTNNPSVLQEIYNDSDLDL